MSTRPRDRTGQRFGALVAVREAGRLPNGRRTWLYRCDCGCDEEMSPLNVDRADGRGWKACSRCRAKSCKMCGAPIVTAAPGVTLTCSPECRHANDLLLAREAAARVKADPDRHAARLAHERAWRADPERHDMHVARRARRTAREAESRAANPAAAEVFRERYRAQRAKKRLAGLMGEASRLEDGE